MTFPAALNLERRLCLVVGATEEAESRVRRLLHVGARVRWVRGAVSEGVDDPSMEHAALSILTREMADDDVDGCWLAVYTDGDGQVAARLGAACEARQVFFCSIDQPGYNSFNHVAIVDQAPVQIAISTGGKVPALARSLRRALQGLLGDGRLAQFARRLERLREETPSEERRQRLSEALAGFSIEGTLKLPSDGESEARGVAAPSPPGAAPQATSGHSNSGKPDSGSGAG